MAARRPRYLSPEEIVQLLQDLSENESGVEEHNIDDDMDYEPPQNFERNNSSSESEDSTEEQSLGQGSPNAQGIGSKRKHDLPNSGYARGRGCLFQNHEEGSIYVSKDGTSWTVTSTSQTTAGKYGAQNMLKEMPGPTSYAKRNVGDNVLSAWRLFVDESMLRHIKKCTEAEAVLNNEENWAISLEELDAFIAIIYERGSYGCNDMDYDFLWNNTWGPPFFRETMSRNRFRDIMKYLRFDLKSTRTQRLESDKFSLFFRYLEYIYTEL
ncbi:uncharacterized protein LOC118199990 [Stegodyphus dumicola]|uniref:uncharacterized protein LOC118199990 n=1 Tax=Stegodyphus dumicola TaxID=202533 RepID=UPI0015B175B2|nr:uncharacterized protein LOC118199990 [Stegodyphus dumicola]